MNCFVLVGGIVGIVLDDRWLLIGRGEQDELEARKRLGLMYGTECHLSVIYDRRVLGNG